MWKENIEGENSNLKLRLVSMAACIHKRYKRFCNYEADYRIVIWHFLGHAIWINVFDNFKENIFEIVKGNTKLCKVVLIQNMCRPCSKSTFCWQAILRCFSQSWIWSFDRTFAVWFLSDSYHGNMYLQMTPWCSLRKGTT